MGTLGDHVSFPALASTSIEAFGLAANSAPVSLTAGSPAHTKGAWVELIAATTKRTIYIFISVGGATTYKYLVDIGTGGAGSEAVLIPNIPAITTAITARLPFCIPIQIPAGTRLSARCQCSTASGACAISGELLEVD